MRALIELGHMERPDPEGPGMFTLADPGALRELMESAGFVEISLDTVKIERPQVSLDEYLNEQLDLSLGFKEARERLDDQQWDEVRNRITELAEQYTGPDGSMSFPARCRLASAST
jgi:hypothetical protein